MELHRGTHSTVIGTSAVNISTCYRNIPFTRLTDIFLQTAVGGVLSTTVTVAEQVDELPAASATVRVTVFAPALLQSNEEGLTFLVLMLHYRYCHHPHQRLLWKPNHSRD